MVPRTQWVSRARIPAGGDPCRHLLLLIRQPQELANLSLHHRENVSMWRRFESLQEASRTQQPVGMPPGHSGHRKAVGIPALVPARPPEVLGFDDCECLADFPERLYPRLDDRVLSLELGLLIRCDREVSRITLVNSIPNRVLAGNPPRMQQDFPRLNGTSVLPGVWK